MEMTGERQVAPTLAGIRADHVARYAFAAACIPQQCSDGVGTGLAVLDIACGVGYGSKLLTDALPWATVTAVDQSAEAIGYANAHYDDSRISWKCSPADTIAFKPDEFSAAVCFETIEHIRDPDPLLRKLRLSSHVLIASVPNEDVIPFGSGFAFHHRHYTRSQFSSLLESTGWSVVSWHGQADGESSVTSGAHGRTLVAVCRRAEMQGKYAPDRSGYDAMVKEFPVPEHVCILGLGPSLEKYVDIAKRLGGKHAFCDEVWGINAVGGVVLCDRIFHMDDVRLQEVRAAAEPESNIARMLEWLRCHPGPIVTSRSHPDYPGLVEFPLEDVLNSTNQAYFNSTAAYAVAYAVHLGVQKISLFGMDFTYPNSHHAEKGRACVEFWLGIASARGIKISVPKESSLLDALHSQDERLYGYDSLDVYIRSTPEGKAAVEFTPRATLPAAAEIESRYDHSRHPNHLVSSAQECAAAQDCG